MVVLRYALTMMALLCVHVNQAIPWQTMVQAAMVMTLPYTIKLVTGVIQQTWMNVWMMGDVLRHVPTRMVPLYVHVAQGTH